MSGSTVKPSLWREAPSYVWNELLTALASPPSGSPVTSGRIRLRTLIILRWLAVLGQTVTVLIVGFVLGFELPITACLLVAAASAAFNLYLNIRHPFTKRLSVGEATFHSGFDIVQLGMLLALTGGLQNPFTLLLLAPVTISASTLPLRSTCLLGGLAFAIVTALAFWHWPLPWRGETPLQLNPIYISGIWLSMTLGIVFNSTYAWWVSREAERMQTALTATQQVLAREQRFAALGGLAAAAAHELGTPLATIALVAKEMSREIRQDSPLYEDVRLLRDQSERCREILSRLSHEPGQGDALYAQMSLSALLDLVAAPHRDLGIAIDIETRASEPDAGDEPYLERRPEIVYGIGNVVENAVDFATARVRLSAFWSPTDLHLTISDDGPGFAPEVIERLGEPYVTTRRPLPDLLGDPTADAHDIEGQHGMGLGFFIAKTLLEQTGAQISIANAPGGTTPGARGGAVVCIQWPIERIRTSH